MRMLLGVLVDGWTNDFEGLKLGGGGFAQV